MGGALVGRILEEGGEPRLDPGKWGKNEGGKYVRKLGARTHTTIHQEEMCVCVGLGLANGVQKNGRRSWSNTFGMASAGRGGA